MLIFNTVIPYICVIAGYLYIRRRIKEMGPHSTKVHFTVTSSNKNSGFTNSSLSASNSNHSAVNFTDGNNASNVGSNFSIKNWFTASTRKNNDNKDSDGGNITTREDCSSSSTAIINRPSSNNDNTYFENNSSADIVTSDDHSDSDATIITNDNNASFLPTSDSNHNVSSFRNNNDNRGMTNEDHSSSSITNVTNFGDNEIVDIVNREDRSNSSTAIITNIHNNSDQNKDSSMPITIKRKSAHYRRVTRLTFRIVLIYGITWTPSIIYYSIVTMTPDIFDASYYVSPLEMVFTYTIKYITFFNAATAPVIYCYNHTMFRKEAKKLFMLITGRTVDDSRSYNLKR